MSTPLREVPLDGNGVIDWRPGKLWSLWDMFELNASDFYNATRHIRNLATTVRSAVPQEVIPEEVRKFLKDAIRNLLPHLESLRATVTWIEADRALRNMDTIPELYYELMVSHLEQIELRLQDELLLRKMPPRGNLWAAWLGGCERCDP